MQTDDEERNNENNEDQIATDENSCDAISLEGCSDEEESEGEGDETDDEQLMQIAIKNGMVTLSSQLEDMLKNGTTSLEEVIRIGIN